MPDHWCWPARMRIIIRKERPHAGAQLRFTDPGGHRFTAFAADTKRGQLADLELRHPRRALTRYLPGSRAAVTSRRSRTAQIPVLFFGATSTFAQARQYLAGRAEGEVSVR
jgi:hypothetical protein